MMKRIVALLLALFTVLHINTYGILSAEAVAPADAIAFTYEITGEDSSDHAASGSLVTLNVYLNVTSPTARIWGVNLDLKYNENLTLLSVDGCILALAFSTPIASANKDHAVMIAQDMVSPTDKTFETGKYLFSTLTFRVADDCPAQDAAIAIVASKSDVASMAAGDVLTTDFGTGAVIHIGEERAIYGDATGDGVIDGMDVIRLKKYLANYNYETGTSTVEIADSADATGDGTIDGMDVIRLKKYLANFNYETGTSTIPLGPQ